MFKFKETVELRLIGAQQQHKVLKREVKKRLINKAWNVNSNIESLMVVLVISSLDIRFCLHIHKNQLT